MERYKSVFMESFLKDLKSSIESLTKLLKDYKIERFFDCVIYTHPLSFIAFATRSTERTKAAVEGLLPRMTAAGRVCVRSARRWTMPKARMRALY